MNRSPTERLIRIAARILSLCLIAAAAACYVSYRQDGARLREAAIIVTADASSPEDKVLALLHWVHRITGTRKNEGFFVLPGQRATPIQVMRGGGDCADKSRLLSSLLREVGVPATMVMCFDPQTQRPSHTFVEAQLGSGGHMVVDPAYDLYFPKPGAAGYYGLLELRHDPTILPRRLDALCSVLPSSAPVHQYNRRQAVYTMAGSINWGKNAITRFARLLLSPRLGDAIHRLPRPMPLEEPKMFVAVICFVIGTMALLIPGLTTRLTRRRTCEPDLAGREFIERRIKAPHA